MNNSARALVTYDYIDLNGTEKLDENENNVIYNKIEKIFLFKY